MRSKDYSKVSEVSRQKAGIVRVSALDGFEGESVIAGTIQEVLKERGVEYFYLKDEIASSCKCAQFTPGAQGTDRWPC